MKTTVTVLIAGLAFSCQSFAASPADRQAVEELLAITKAQEIQNQVDQQGAAMVSEWIAQMHLSPADGALIAKYSARADAALREATSWETLKPQYVEAYLSVFSEKDIRQLTKFYRSSLGQRMVAATPKLVEASVAILSNAMMVALPKVEAIVQEMATEIAASKQ